MKLKNLIFTVLGLIAISFMMEGCGGGGGGDTSPQANPLQGIWRGSYTEDGTVYENTVFGMIDQYGYTNMIIEPVEALMGDLGSENGQITYGELSYYSLGYYGGYAHAYNGTIVPQTSLNVDMTYTPYGSSTPESNISVDLVYDPIYERDSSLALVSGNWVNESETIQFTIDSNGNISGYNYRDDCAISGNIYLKESEYNLYTFKPIYNCTNADYQMYGMSTLNDTNTLNDTMIYVMNGSFHNEEQGKFYRQ